MGRVLLLAATCWIAGLFTGLATLGVTAAWAGPGLQRVPVALGAYVAIVVVALAGTVYAVHRGASRLLAPDQVGVRIAFVLVFGALQMVTFVFLGFVGLLGFNR